MPRLRQQSLRALEAAHVHAAERWPLAHVARIGQSRPHARLRRQREVVIAHAPDRGKTMRRELHCQTGQRRWRIQRIGQQVVVPKILIAPKAGVEVVPTVPVHAQPRGAVGVAPIAETRQRQVVEQRTRMIHRLHFQRLLQQPRPSMQVHERVIDGFIAAAGGVAPP